MNINVKVKVQATDRILEENIVSKAMRLGVIIRCRQIQGLRRVSRTF